MFTYTLKFEVHCVLADSTGNGAAYPCQLSRLVSFLLSLLVIWADAHSQMLPFL